ncbi:MAG: histidine phosphatase family protein [Myxococcota bacterium]|nr:histidine phosphatase family protein [Myxococcota bacterium]
MGDTESAARRITLVRHGRPDVSDGLMAAPAFADFWQRYDEAGITADSKPPAALRRTLAECDLYVTSTLPRAQQSLARIAPDAVPRIDARFREIGIPPVPVPALRLPGHAWSVVGRLAWLGRLVSADESVRQAARRVRGAALQLAEWSEEYEHIGVVTHGFFNGWLAPELRRLGFRGARLGTPRHWSFDTLTRSAR